MNNRNKVAWFVFVALAIAIGLYPLLYLFVDREFGLLASKDESLLSNVFWNIGFYGHIIFGGIALLVGWVQFSRKMRTRYLDAHRLMGKIYVLSVIVSGVCGVYIGFYATGGFVSSVGFIALGIFWLFTTIRAYQAVRKGDIELHQGYMVYSYALCFAAVTLRIWLPLLSIAFGDFVSAYRLVAWLCWVPNVIFAYFWVRKKGLQLG